MNALKQKEALEKDEIWVPKLKDFNAEMHSPKLSIDRLEKRRKVPEGEIAKMERVVAQKNLPAMLKERSRRDIEDARGFLQASGQLLLEFGNKGEEVEKKADIVADKEPPPDDLEPESS